MSRLSFSLESDRRIREACQKAGLTGDLSLTEAKKFVFHTWQINDNYQLEKFKTIIFSVDAFEKKGKEPFGEGFFHLAFKAADEEGHLWVIKKPKRAEEVQYIPADVLKQHFAFKAAQFFSDEVCKKGFLGQNIFLRYLRPLIASGEVVFKDGRRKKLDLIFEVENFMNGEFTRFNWPAGPTDDLLNATRLFPNRLPQVFSRWVYDVTDKNALIADVQGCKKARGQYLCTDPIVHFNNTFSCGLVDWHIEGMVTFMDSYKKLLAKNSGLRDLDEMDCFKPTSSQMHKMDRLAKRIMRLANKELPGNIAQMVQSKVRGRQSRSRSF